MITPSYLRPGDTIGIIAPARHIAENEISGFLELVVSWGLKYKTSKHVFGKYFQYSGTDRERAYDFQQMLDDPEIKALICVRGGYGSIRILRYIDFSSMQKSPKWLVGFSDITVLHSYINKFTGIESLHALMPLNYKSGESDMAVDSLRTALFGRRLSYMVTSNTFNRNGLVKAELIGGNLSLLYSMNGTNFFPDMKNKILFIEDVDEYMYHIDRMMQNLLHSGVFGRIKGLIVGSFTDIKDNDIPFGMNIYQIIRSTVEQFDFPVCFDFPAGHISSNMTLIFGREVQLNVREEGAEVEFSG